MPIFPLLIVALAAGLGGGAVQVTDEQRAELGRYFGFGPMEIYKFEPGINQLKIADLNGDARLDIAAWNRRKSRIEVLYQPDPARPSAAAKELDRNEIPSRGTMVGESLAVPYNVAAMEIADVTGDGLNDFILYGESKELVIIPAKKGGGFDAAVTIRAPDGNAQSGALAVGDFNGDKRTDVALLGSDLLQVFLQKLDGGLAKPFRLAHGIKNPLLMLASDLDGDGRDDLVITADDERYGVYAYLQESDGTLGALRRLRVPKTRSVTAVRAPARGVGDDLLCVEAETGRLMRYHWKLPPEVGIGDDWPQRLYSYPVKSAGKRRPVALGDLNSDGYDDCVVLDPDAGQIFFFAGTGHGFSAARAFPGLMRATDALITDLEHDGKAELISVSADEKIVGVSKLVEGRVTYPAPLAVKGAPLVFAHGSLQVGGPAERFAYVTRDNRNLQLVIVSEDGKSEQVLELDGFDDDPEAIRFADVNQDNLNDILIFVHNGPLHAYLQQNDLTFLPLAGKDTRDGLVKECSVVGFAMADVNNDGKAEALIAQRNLVRAMVVKNGRWEVVDQYNPESADAQIGGVTVLPGPTIAIYERKSRELLIFKQREDKTFAVAQSLPVGNYELTAMEPLLVSRHGAAKDAQPTWAVLLADAEKLATLTAGERAETLVETFAYESKAKDSHLADAVAGDLNGDGVRDVVVMDQGKASLEILTTMPDQSLVNALRFQVFQGKRFADAPEGRGEPREVLIGDVNGDKLDDIVLIAHDRIIVYPGQ